MEMRQMIEAVQRKLGVDVDGRAGPQTWGAIYAALVDSTLGGGPPEQAVSKVDERSERNIATLLPEVRPLARALVQRAAQDGIQVKVISGTRSYAEQDALYAQGRTAPGMIVTKARGGESNHNFGIAFDVGIFEGTKYLENSPRYMAVGAIGIDLGLEWGGSWESFADQPHFQLRPTWAAELSEKQMLAALRSRIEAGSSVFA
jgi:peptidoglycan L-alanyl-D-glutamate endopeptidase CwlK